MNRYAIGGASLLAMWAGPAWAHPGHGSAGFSAGLLHPLTGADHLMAMLLAGLWAGLMMRQAMWVLPAAFLTAMLAGFGSGTGFGAATAEMLILLSLLALGTAVAMKVRAPVVLAVVVVGLFGFAHGLAHGLETPAGAQPWGFATGFLVSTAMLHVAGLALARLVPVAATRTAGMLGVGLGAVLMVAA
jgi:urease accessory protein